MSSPLTGTFEDVDGVNNANVRKMQKMAVFVAPLATAAITSIVDSSNVLSIPAGYVSLGHMSRDDGAAITPSLDISELNAYNDGQPIRRDVTSRTTTLAFTMLESKRQSFELYYGVDLSAIQATASPKNEVKFDLPDLPALTGYRVLLLGKDGSGTSTIYHAEHYLHMLQTDVGARTWSPTDGFVWPVTLSAQTDDTAGTPTRVFWAGPGLTTSRLTEMGFTRSP